MDSDQGSQYRVNAIRFLIENGADPSLIEETDGADAWMCQVAAEHAGVGRLAAASGTNSGRIIQSARITRHGGWVDTKRLAVFRIETRMWIFRSCTSYVMRRGRGLLFEADSGLWI